MPSRFLEQDSEVDGRATASTVLDRDNQAEPAVLAERFVGLTRRVRLGVATLGIFRRTDFIDFIEPGRPRNTARRALHETDQP